MLNHVANKLAALGGLLALAGVASSVLYFLEYNLRLLMWVDLWGPIVGWVIRAALIIGGLAMAAVFGLMVDGPDEHGAPRRQ